MSRRIISQAEAHATARALRALRDFLLRSYDRKLHAVDYRSAHLGSVELTPRNDGTLRGMEIMSRGTGLGVALLGDLQVKDGKRFVEVYAIAVPNVRDDPSR
jgi:hypothetical protein